MLTASRSLDLPLLGGGLLETPKSTSCRLSDGISGDFRKTTIQPLKHQAQRTRELDDTNLPIKALDQELPLPLRNIILQTNEGLLLGMRPQAIEEGMGGAYFLSSRTGQKLAVFKAADEEPCSPNNQKGLSGSIGDRSIKKGILSGEQAIREVAAFVLDHHGSANVPPTIPVSIQSNHFAASSSPLKTGSFQVYVDSVGSAGDFGPSSFSTLEVQEIAVLDMKLLNTDRHDGNILVTRARNGTSGSLSLVPIDHGCCLPDSLEVCSFEWCFMEWPQLRKPILQSVRENILASDIEADSKQLNQLGVRGECIRTMRLATTFLQMCVKDFELMTLADIAALMTRSDQDVESQLESLWRTALALSLDESDAERLFPKVIREYLTLHWTKWSQH